MVKVMRNTLNPVGMDKIFPATNKWIRSCYNMPTGGEIKMEALDELAGTFGVEAVMEDGNYHSPICTYLNTGDPYATTIVRMGCNDYRLTSWGDVVEQAERDGISVR